MFEGLFKNPKPVVGVIHVGALPGTPGSRLDVRALTSLAAREAAAYRDGGADGLMVENMHDVPYLRGGVGPEIVAAMAVVGRAVKESAGLPTGVQILAGANTEAVAVAHAAGLDYVRAEGYAFAHIADEGWIESSAARGGSPVTPPETMTASPRMNSTAAAVSAKETSAVMACAACFFFTSAQTCTRSAPIFRLNLSSSAAEDSIQPSSAMCAKA